MSEKVKWVYHGLVTGTPYDYRCPLCDRIVSLAPERVGGYPCPNLNCPSNKPEPSGIGDMWEKDLGRLKDRSNRTCFFAGAEAQKGLDKEAVEELERRLKLLQLNYNTVEIDDDEQKIFESDEVVGKWNNGDGKGVRDFCGVVICTGWSFFIKDKSGRGYGNIALVDITTLKTLGRAEVGK